MQFLYQNVLFLMLLPIIILIFLIATKKSSLETIFSPEILSQLSISNKHLNKSTRNILLFIALILMTISLARPVVNEKEQNIEQELTPIIVAIDVSKSMFANDIYPSRLAMAKRKLLTLIEQSKDVGIGVTLFAKSAFILSPVTQDFNSLTYLVNNFDNNINFDNGSNILAMLEASKKLLKDYSSKNIILLTDGGNKKEHSKEIAFAQENNLTIYTLAVATTKPTPIPTENGYLTNKDNSIVTVALNESIKDLSLNTQGGYIPFTLNQSDISAILNDIRAKSDKVLLESQKFKVYTELFYYPLGLALFILLIAFSSLPKKNLSLLLLSFIISQTPLEASLMDFKNIDEANKAYEQKEYNKASTEFSKVLQTPQGQYNFANSLYKQEKYKSALKAYQEVTTTNDTLEFKKLHNLGNTYVKLQDLKNAQKMYEKALKLQKNKQTEENLEMVKKALENQKKKQNKQQGDKNKKSDKDEKKKNNKKKNTKKSGQDEKKNQKNQQPKESNQNGNEQKKQDKKKSKKESKEKNKQSSEQKNVSQEANEKKMSNLEEKKWMDLIKNKQVPVMLRKVESKNPDDSSTPW